jgi:cytochrome c biogenesis protein CcdA/thiol-disulfide isomerase/thioredoxin
MFTLFITSYIAGVLTVLAPCVLPLLPIIIGSSVAANSRWKPFVITASLAFSLTLFTLLLKASTLLIDIPPEFWKYVSGGIIIFFGVITLFPNLWSDFSTKLGLSTKSDSLLEKSTEKGGLFGAILIGMSLGPVFASCSPTYSLILATVLPVNFAEGILYIITYALGLSSILLLISFLGRSLVNKLKVVANPNSWFKKILGILFIIVGLAIITGFDKKVETFILDSGYFDITKVEQNILEKNMPKDMKLDSQTIPIMGQTNFEKINGMKSIPELNVVSPTIAPEIKDISQWFNSDGETLADLKGKVVLVDFWTYSCINCQRTLPYLTKWYDTYKDKGFVVLGLHAPEFAFEKVPANVQKAIQENKINYPVGLDNDFGTWKNYKNQFWPASYLIDKEGKIRRTHFGEGEYVETEKAIQFLLGEKNTPTVAETVKGAFEDQYSKDCVNKSCPKKTAETYLGSNRAKNQVKFDSELQSNQWAIDSSWVQEDEKIVGSQGSLLKIKVNASKVYLVAGSKQGTGITVKINGTQTNNFWISDEKLYEITNNTGTNINTEFELMFDGPVELNAFTFG